MASTLIKVYNVVPSHSLFGNVVVLKKAGLAVCDFHRGPSLPTQAPADGCVPRVTVEVSGPALLTQTSLPSSNHSACHIMSRLGL